MGERKPIIIIEHLEKQFGIWVFLEYRHSSIIYGKEYIWFTNVPLKYRRILGKYGRVFSESIVVLVKKNMINKKEVLILDPQSKKKLTYNDLLNYKYIIVGGILGDHPPRGRTKKLLTDNLPDIESRNIGEKQYSIDGSIYYVNYLWRNKSMDRYQYVDGVEIETLNGSIYLPFRYPVVNGKPLLAPGLKEYLVNGSIPDNILNELKQ